MNVYLDSVGCRLNQSEIDRIARQFAQAGHQLVEDALQADLVVINTCAVTAKAASDSRGKIRQAVRMNPNVKIISTGCWSTLDADRAAQMENVVKVALNQEKENLVGDYLSLPENYFNTTAAPYDILIPGSHAHIRAFIKVQDGCDNFCTFCVTRIARGKSVSLSAREIITEIQSIADNGTHEVVLSGVNLGAWGRDLPNSKQLSDLLQMILKETDIPRIRLSSLEPWDIGEDFFSLWKNPRLCRHFHLPLQSGSDSVLKRMGRRITTGKYLALAQAAQQMIPDLALTTDIIVGFPGETEEEFQQTLAFVKQINFSGGHIFSYSARPGTPADRMDGLIEKSVKKERSLILREAFKRMGENFRTAQVGKQFQVLWETSHPLDNGKYLSSGLTDTYLRIKMESDLDLAGTIQSIQITGQRKGILQGKKF